MFPTSQAGGGGDGGGGFTRYTSLGSTTTTTSTSHELPSSSSTVRFQDHSSSHFHPMPNNNQNIDPHGKVKTSTTAFPSSSNQGIGMRSWDEAHPVMFSVAQTKHDDLNVESQFQFSLGMPSMQQQMNSSSSSIPQDSVPCKIRAKRGCATHPRSIAERERRTRISGKLKKLHDLVPNMDKQTSYADMLDLAVQHIKTLQTKVENLKGELESCKCGCKNATHL